MGHRRLYCFRNMSQVKWVLVAGTGQYHLPNSVLWVSQALGTELGRRGFGLVNGGWEGVDWVVSETFAKELEGKGVPLASLLLQVVRERSYHEYPGGRIVYVPLGTLEFTESIKYCDAVVLIGGEGGTYQSFQIARQEQKPIFPVPGTGGDAQRAFRDILSDWPMPLPRRLRNRSSSLSTRHRVSQRSRLYRGNGGRLYNDVDHG